MATDPAPLSRTAALGRWGEQLAAEHLRADGLELLARNWRCDIGELDIVARETDGTVVFVEVKTRGGTGFGLPAEAVGQVKARKLRTLARRWLMENPGAPALRFDVIGIVRRPGERPEISHLRSAF